MSYQELAELAERIEHLRAVFNDTDRVCGMDKVTRRRLYNELLLNEELFHILTRRRG